MSSFSFTSTFVQTLASADVPDGYSNPYISHIARANLEQFLNMHVQGDTRLVMIGEAPGYKGAALSGVALTSPDILISPWNDPWSAFGPSSGFKVHPGCRISKEATATIFWRAVAEIFDEHPLPMTWNAVPFHPTGKTGYGNGPVTVPDVEIGEYWIRLLAMNFADAQWVAIGKRAGDALDRLGISNWPVRHPSRGGKREFVEDLRRIKKSLQP